MKGCINLFGVNVSVSSSGKTPEVFGERFLTKLASWGRCGWQLGIALGLGIGSVIALPNALAFAQITPDATLGAESSQVTSPIPRGFLIEGGATRGTNLFHSFSQFSVPTNGIAYFNNALNIQNIITRVTGTSVSNIDGFLAANGTANLFLINPNGILFGPNAQLSIGGSFLASTANSFIFPNGTSFSATNPQAPPLLTTSVPIGLQYGSNPGNIVNQASTNDDIGRILGLQVLPGRSIALVGGDVTFSAGGVSAVGGRVEIGGLTTAGIVGLTIEGNTLRLGFPPDISRGNVTLTDDARVGVRGVGGGDIVVNANNFTAINGGRLVAGTQGAGNGGDITINATNAISIGGFGTSGNQSGVYNETLSSAIGNAGNININAREVYLSGGLAPFQFGTISSSTYGQGNAGNVTINTETLSIRGGASVGTSTSGSGAGGNVTVNASESVEVMDLLPNVVINDQIFIVNSTLGATTSASGKGGDLTINTKRLLIRDGAVVQANTFAQGSGGNLTINASEFVELSGTSTIDYSVIGITDFTSERGSLLSAQTNGSGDAGNLIINTGRLTVRDGASISAGTYDFYEGGNAGSITIRARDVEVVGESAPGGKVSDQSQIVAVTGGGGNAGNISIDSERLIVRDGGTIDTLSDGDGNAGFITIRAKDVQVIGSSNSFTNDSQISATAGSLGIGNGGGVLIDTERLIVRDGANIEASTIGSGNAGFITIRATDVELSGTNPVFPGFYTRSGLFTFTTSTGSGGDITIDTERLSLRDGAAISASSLSGDDPVSAGNGGNILIKARDFVELIGASPLSRAFLPSSISSETLSRTPNTGGNGGTIILETGRLTLRDGANISASASGGTGNAGFVNVRARDVELIGTSTNGQFPSRLSAKVDFGTSSKGDPVETSGNGGSVSVDTEQLTIRDGAEISTSTVSIGNAGSVNVRARNVQLIGTSADGSLPSRLSAQAFSTAVGNGGSVRVDTEQLTVRDRAQINVGNQGVGNAGNLAATANSILLDNQGQLNATSTSGKGGSIDLQVNDLLLMRHNSLISAVNGTPDGDGLDGNITINSQFLVAVPKENSDIVANGFGRTPGSNIQVTAQGIFGTQFRERQTPKSDIVATGTVTLNTPGVDPSRGLGELPANLVDASRQIDRRCRSGSTQRNSFTITGRGGIPQGPNDLLQGESIITPNWVSVDSNVSNNTPPAPAPTIPRTSAPKQLVEAQGWMINEKGVVVLTASAPTANPQGEWLPEPNCNPTQN
jgi:filamentous hemagglutinin family protein